MSKNWIKGAIKHPGALHKELHVPEGKKIPSSVLSKAASKGGKLGERARLAETLGHIHHSSGAGHHASTVNVHLHMAPSKGKKKFSL